MAVPQRLRPLLGKSEVKRSLGTGYLRLARAKGQQVGAAVVRFLALLENTQGDGIMLTDNPQEKLQAILDSYVRDSLEEWEEHKASTPGPFDAGFPKGHATALRTLEEKAKDALARNSTAFFEPTVDALLERHGITLDKDSPQYRRFALEVMKREIEAARIGQTRALGDYSDAYAATSPVPTVAPIAQTPAHLQPSAVTLTEGIPLFMEERRQKEKSAKTLEKYRTILAEFVELVGDRPVASLTRADMREYCRVVHLLPKNRTRTKAYKGKTIQQLLAMTIPQSHLMTRGTIDDRFVLVSTLLNWFNVEYPLTLPHLAQLKSGLEVSRKAPTTEKKRAYSDDELRILFEPSVYTGKKVNKAWKYWLPLLGLLTGARLGELCQLLLTDIRQEDASGIWYFDINEEEEDKHLKTEASTRRTPMHPLLEKLGLLRRVHMLQKQKETYLFPSLFLYANPKDPGKAPSKWFSGFRRGRGLGGGPGEASPLTFHTLRNTFITRCKYLDINRSRVKEVVGHEEGEFDDMTGTYEDPWPVKRLYENVVCKLDFSDVLDIERLQCPKWQEW